VEHEVIYKSVKKPIGVRVALSECLDALDGWEFDVKGDNENNFTFDITSDTIEVTVGGKKVDPKKVKIKLTGVD